MTETTPSTLTPDLTDAERIRKLPWSLGQTLTNNVYIVFTIMGTVFTLFMDKLGFSKSQIGLIISLFPFCGMLALFVAPKISRVGAKKAFLWFFGLRKLISAFLLLTPWVVSHYGSGAAFGFVAFIILVFALSRAVAETASLAWTHDIIPPDIRGRFQAVNVMVGSVAAAASLWIASVVLGSEASISSFMTLIGIGVVFGFLSVWSSAYIPGGAPRDVDGSIAHHFKGMGDAIRDCRFAHYLTALGLYTFAAGMVTFVPLYLKDKIGLSPEKVVMLGTIAIPAQLLTCYAWGWVVDRYGSKPVMVLCLIVSSAFTIGWIVMPRGMDASWTIAIALTVAANLFAPGFNMGDQRMLFVDVVAEEKRTTYMAVYFAWAGLIGGLSPIVLGKLLDVGKNWSGHLWIFPIDAYTPLLFGGMLLSFTATFFYRAVQTSGKSTVWDLLKVGFTAVPRWISLWRSG